MGPHRFLRGEPWLSPGMAASIDWIRCVSPVPAMFEVLGDTSVGAGGLAAAGSIASRYCVIAAVSSIIFMFWTAIRLNMRVLDRARAAGKVTDDRSTSVKAYRRIMYLWFFDPKRRDGLIGAHSVADNLILNRYYKSPYSNRGIRQQKAIANYAKEMVEKFDIRTPSIETPSSSLSGGNKQKAIAAREFSHNAQLLVASQPTRGIDVGSIEFVHQQLINQRDQGLAVLLVSAELDEILSLSDRIGVIYRGQLIVTANATDLDRNRIGRIMTTGSDSN